MSTSHRHVRYNTAITLRSQHRLRLPSTPFGSPSRAANPSASSSGSSLDLATKTFRYLQYVTPFSLRQRHLQTRHGCFIELAFFR